MFLADKAEGDIFLAQSGTYSCEEYRHISGGTKYRVSPPIRGSFISEYHLFIKCFVPVSSKTCEYKGSINDWWHICGASCVKDYLEDLDSRDYECLINLTNNGGIVEDDNGRKYYQFEEGTQFRLR